MARVIPTETVVWTAGVGGVSLPQNWDFPTRRNGQVDVLPTLQVADHPEIYIVGDLAHVEQDGHPLQLIATVATQEGEWAARNIRRQIAGAEPEPFQYHDPGMLAVTGRNAAAVRLGRFTFTGFPAWVIWVERAPVPADWVPQPPVRIGQLGLGLHLLRPGGALDHSHCLRASHRKGVVEHGRDCTSPPCSSISAVCCSPTAGTMLLASRLLTASTWICRCGGAPPSDL